MIFHLLCLGVGRPEHLYSKGGLEVSALVEDHVPMPADEGPEPAGPME